MYLNICKTGYLKAYHRFTVLQFQLPPCKLFCVSESLTAYRDIIHEPPLAKLTFLKKKT